MKSEAKKNTKFSNSKYPVKNVPNVSAGKSYNETKLSNELLQLATRIKASNLNFRDVEPLSADQELRWDDSRVAVPKFKENVKPEHSFKLKDGKELLNLHELAIALRQMNDDVFSHHVNENKNDFASWIKDCMGEKQLASELSKYKTKTSNELAVLRHIASQLN
jgi:hypothetical protein